MKVIANNKKAYYELEILETLECGIVLQGTEVKAIRAGNANLTNSYVRISNEECYLLKANIAEYEMGTCNNHEPQRKRKLLLHRRELKKLDAKVQEKGLTLVPIKLYFNDKNLIKLEIGLGRGKKLHDKRASMKKRDTEREIQRIVKDYR